jgi:hypothetical protein
MYFFGLLPLQRRGRGNVGERGDGRGMLKLHGDMVGGYRMRMLAWDAGL